MIMLMFSDEAIPFEGTSGKEVYQNFDFYLSFLSGNSVSGREMEKKRAQTSLFFSESVQPIFLCFHCVEMSLTQIQRCMVIDAYWMGRLRTL